MEYKNKCGTCKWYCGEFGDGSQFCDDKEIYVKDTNIACYRYKYDLYKEPGFGYIHQDLEFK